MRKNRIPKDWTIRKVSQVFDFLSTNSFSRNQMNYEEKEDSIYNIHYGDIHATYTEPILDLEKCKDVPVINEDAAIPTSATFLKDGDLVMADASEDYAGVGETVELINIGNKKVLAGLHTFALRDKNGTTAKGFRTYIFKHPKVATSVKVIATGSKVYGISKTNLANVNVILPPFSEQQKIATILSTWDKAIDKLTQLITSKEQRKKGLMQQLLTGKKRFAGFKDERKEVKLGEVVKFSKGKGISKNDIVYNGRTECIRYGELYTTYNEVIDDVISKTNVNTKELVLSEANDVIIPSSGETQLDIAKASCVLRSGIALGGDLNVLKTNENGVFLSYYLNIVKKTNIAQLSQGVSVVHLYSKQLASMSIKLPTIQEQQKIASVLSAADKEIELLKKELESLQQQKKGLMQVLLTGEKRIQ